MNQDCQFFVKVGKEDKHYLRFFWDHLWGRWTVFDGDRIVYRKMNSFGRHTVRSFKYVGEREYLIEIKRDLEIMTPSISDVTFTIFIDGIEVARHSTSDGIMSEPK